MDLAVSEFQLDDRRYFTGIVRDITERKAAEGALREAEERMRSVVDHVIDGIITIDDKTAYRATLDLARQESVFTGSSGGAAAAGARQVAQSLGADGLVVTLFPDSGERYLSKLNKTWLKEKGLLDE